MGYFVFIYYIILGVYFDGMIFKIFDVLLSCLLCREVLLIWRGGDENIVNLTFMKDGQNE
jgi:hypothetical protein